MNCLIVDDERLARELLKSYINKLPRLKLIAECASSHEAMPHLEHGKVELVLLDIQMPQQSGIDFLRQLGANKPRVIFTTAYPNYALEGFELDVVDYLLKPISFQRFEQAINKALQQQETAQKAGQFDQQQEQFIWVHSEHQHHKILLCDIIYIESLKEYVRYHTTKGRVIQLNSLKRLNEELPSGLFMRVHRSYIIALSRIVHYQNHQLHLEGDKVLPVGKTYRKQVIGRLF
ncbi:MAG: LytR/AlgR family response regulator transcription factor [Aureispira sp.]